MSHSLGMMQGWALSLWELGLRAGIPHRNGNLVLFGSVLMWKCFTTQAWSDDECKVANEM